jgi:hypothetical protein
VAEQKSLRRVGFVLKESALFNLMNTWVEAVCFGADVQHVMALRMTRLASGGPFAATEAQQMLSEKVAAFGEAHWAIMMALANGLSLDAAAAEAYAPYQRRVRANRRRLGRS